MVSKKVLRSQLWKSVGRAGMSVGPGNRVMHPKSEVASA